MTALPKSLFVLPSLAAGGAERVTLQLAGALAEIAPDVELAVIGSGGPLQDMLPDHLPVRLLHRRRLRQALPALLGLLRETRPRLVFSTFAHVTAALIVLRPLLQRGTRPLVVAREPNLPSLSRAAGGMGRLEYAATRFAYPRCDLVIASSSRLADELRRAFRVRADAIEILPNPIDQRRLRGLADSAPEQTPARRPWFVTSGRLVRQKGLDRLLPLWRHAPAGFGLVVLGDGPERAALERQARQLGLADRIRFLGHRSNPWNWYANASGFLLASRFEGMPNAALEALACGTPVVATPESGGLPELLPAIPEGGLRIAALGPEYLAAIEDVAARPWAPSRASLLPAAFGIEQVRTRLHHILGGLGHRAKGPDARRGDRRP